MGADSREDFLSAGLYRKWYAMTGMEPFFDFLKALRYLCTAVRGMMKHRREYEGRG